MRRVSATGQLWHDGHHYHLGEVFAHCRVALHQDATDRTELHFANVHLVFDPAERFRPTSLRRIKNHSPNLTQKLN